MPSHGLLRVMVNHWLISSKDLFVSIKASLVVMTFTFKSMLVTTKSHHLINPFQSIPVESTSNHYMNTNQVTKPVMTLKSGNHSFQIWVLNPGQWCQCTPASCHEFHAGKTASIIYESFGAVGMHECIEYPLNHPTIWNWIQGHMQDHFNPTPSPVS